MLDHTYKEKIFQILSENGYYTENIKLKPLHEGGNNKIFKIQIDTKSILAKFYFLDSHDRLETEWNFLNYATKKGIQCIPTPIAKDKINKIALYEFIEGQKPLKNEITLAEIDQAADFFNQLNQNVSHKNIDLPIAAEACFSILDHFNIIDNRLNKIEKIKQDSQLTEELQDFISTFKKTWKQLKIKTSAIMSEFDIKPDVPLNNKFWCISPSDFGFHNSLRLKNGMLCFIDFEYAGWDDPAKMVADFFLQPSIPIDPTYLEYFMEKVFISFPNMESLKRRTYLLHPLFTMKWSCIMLNCFIPEYLDRILFADPYKDVNSLQMERLKHANLYLSHVCI